MQETGNGGSTHGSGRQTLGKEMAPHSSILAWEIPWTEQHGRLQSMGSQRVRHNLVTKQFMYVTHFLHVSVDGHRLLPVTVTWLL